MRFKARHSGVLAVIEPETENRKPKTVLKLTWRNTVRRPLRAALTICGMAVAVLAFALLRTVVAAWYSGVNAASPARLVTRNAISLVFPLPIAYLPKIQAIPGIAGVAYGCWFGGTYIDERHFFPQFAVDVRRYFPIYPEYVIPEDQKLAFFQDRRGAAVGRTLAARTAGSLGTPSSSRVPFTPASGSSSSGPSIPGPNRTPMNPGSFSTGIT